MSSISLFPALGRFTDLDSKILSDLDPQSLVAFSSTRHHAFAVLSNDTYFKKLFESKHPFLGDSQSALIQLWYFHRMNCFKIASCYYSKGYHEKPVSVFVQAIPKIIKILEPRKEKNEAKLKEVCGEGEDDPTSPLNQARDAYQASLKLLGFDDWEKAKQFVHLKMHGFEDKIKRGAAPIRAHYIEDNFEKMICSLTHRGNEQILEGLRERNADFGVFRIEDLSTYERIVQKSQKHFKRIDLLYDTESKLKIYNGFLCSKDSYEKQIEQIREIFCDLYDLLGNKSFKADDYTLQGYPKIWDRKKTDLIDTCYAIKLRDERSLAQTKENLPKLSICSVLADEMFKIVKENLPNQEPILDEKFDRLIQVFSTIEMNSFIFSEQFKSLALYMKNSLGRGTNRSLVALNHIHERVLSLELEHMYQLRDFGTAPYEL